jgi:hypothetical protein
MIERFRKYHEWIELYNLGKLEGKELEEFEAMLRKDKRLRSETKLDKELDIILLDEDVLELRRIILEARRTKERAVPIRKILLMAASVAILVTIGLVIILCTGKEDQKFITRHPPSHLPAKEPVLNSKNQVGEPAKNDKAKILLAARYSPYPPLENLVGVIMRGTSAAVVEPRASIISDQNSKIRFSWKPEDGKMITFELCNNAGKRVRYLQKPGCCSFSLQTSGLEPGLYYWKCFSDYKLVRVGKIEIR